MNHKMKSTGLLFLCLFGLPPIMLLIMSLKLASDLKVLMIIALPLWIAGLIPHGLGATCSFLRLQGLAETFYLLALNNFRLFAWPNQRNIDDRVLPLVDCYLKGGKVSEAITATRNWVKWKETTDVPHPGHSQTLHTLNNKLIAAHYPEEADAIAVELIEHRQNLFGKNHESVAEARLLRANFRPESLETVIAEQEYLKALATFKSGLSVPSKATRKSFKERIADFSGISVWQPETLSMALSCSLSLADLYWGKKEFARAHQTLADGMSLADQYSNRHTQSSRMVCRQIKEIQRQNQVNEINSSSAKSRSDADL